jgi:hypothetical protein
MATLGLRDQRICFRTFGRSCMIRGARRTHPARKRGAMNPMRCIAVGLAATLAVVLSCSSSGQSGPCAMAVVMSCNGGTTCHEFYSQAAADAVRADCVSLGQAISDQPCPHSLPDCCIEQNGSNGYPEGICLAAGQWETGPVQCTGSGYTSCER